VQTHLRNGEGDEFVALSDARDSPTEKDEVIRLAAESARQYLEAHPPRELLIKNCTPVLLRAAHVLPGNHTLELIVDDLLRYVFHNINTVEIPEIIEIRDLFDYAPTVWPAQREQCIASLAGLFNAQMPFPAGYSEYWKEFLDHADQLTATVKATLCENIEGKYNANTTAQTAAALQMLAEATQHTGHSAWVATPPVLIAISKHITFDGSEEDRSRLSVLRFFHDSLASRARRGSPQPSSSL
jgi:hypothetical protein